MPSFILITLAAVGGAIGSALRYVMAGWVQALSRSLDFPYGTLAVNLIGCFIIGLLMELAEARGLFTQEARVFVFIGILGGFTTFSSFGNETFNLFRAGQTANALLNIGANVVIGLAAVWLGHTIAYLIWR